MKPGWQSTEARFLLLLDLIVFGMAIAMYEVITPAVLISLFGVNGAYIGERWHLKRKNGP